MKEYLKPEVEFVDFTTEEVATTDIIGTSTNDGNAPG